MNRAIGDLLLFAGPGYYPRGGGRDFIGRYATMSQIAEDLQRGVIKKTNPEEQWWWHVFDLKYNAIGWEGNVP